MSDYKRKLWHPREQHLKIIRAVQEKNNIKTEMKALLYVIERYAELEEENTQFWIQHSQYDIQLEKLNDAKKDFKNLVKFLNDI